MHTESTVADFGVCVDVVDRGCQALLVFELVGEKFHAVQVNRSVANLPGYSNGFIGARILELDLDLTSYGQVGSGKQTNPAFA